MLRRLNRFLELIHDKKGDAAESASRIDVAREILEDLEVIKPLTGRLESAFPVKPGWRNGALTSEAVQRPDIESQVRHFDLLWLALLERYAVRPLRSTSERIKRGLVLLDKDRLMPKEAENPGTGEKLLLLELRSQASGGATLLRCTSEVGRLDLRNDNGMLDDLYHLQRSLGQAKVCVHRDDDRLDRVTVEGDLPFSPTMTQLEELELLVSRTVGGARAASLLRQGLVETS